MSLRKFVNLVSSDSFKSVYTLRRIDMSRFFLPTTNGTMKHQDSASCLPDPVINFYPPQNLNLCGRMNFMLVDGKVVAKDGAGGAFIYDTDKHAVRSLPDSLSQFKTYINSVTVGSDLYIIDKRTNGTGTRTFQALVYTAPTPVILENWQWRALPPPPPPSQERDDCTSIDSCAAAADGSQIWMSAHGEGAVKSCTHLFDTRSLLWSKQPADWVLPFLGSAQYVPELQKLWFGISSSEHDNAFCAADLSTASLSQPPVLRAVFDDEMPAGIPKDRLVSAQAVHLGSGRFCIARFFSLLKTPDDGSPIDPLDLENIMVLTGVEVVSSSGDGGLSLVKHRSGRYMFFDIEQHWVL